MGDGLEAVPHPQALGTARAERSRKAANEEGGAPVARNTAL